MRAVSLSDKTVQEKIEKSFIPLKIKISYGTDKFPVDWPALKIWQDTYTRMGGPKTTGITACSVVSPSLKVELGSTGSAFVWEMFDSIAYDAKKFADMLDRAVEREARERAILVDKPCTTHERGNRQGYNLDALPLYERIRLACLPSRMLQGSLVVLNS